jgi:hypothetical protein
MSGKRRGRFEIVAVFPSGGSLRITSDKARSLTLPELVKSLREYADTLDRAIQRESEIEDKANG